MHLGQNIEKFETITDDKWIKIAKGEEEATDIKNTHLGDLKYQQKDAASERHRKTD